MKWLVFILPFLFLAQPALAVPLISDDFYLNNGEVYDSDAVEASGVLPNTLRLVIAEGEREKLHADIVPDGVTGRRLSWSLPEHRERIEIYPDGESCTVVGIKAGEEIIRIEAEGGAAASVAVVVEKAPEIRTRSFEYEGETKKTAIFTDGVMRTVVRVLITLGAALVLAAILAAVKRRGETKDENAQ